MNQRSKKAFRTFIGGLVLLVGVVAIPYPGPGWLIVFAGLAILAKDYKWAQDALSFTRKKYDDWNAWIKRQSRFVQSLTFLTTALIVVITLWIINAYGLINSLLNLNQDWLNSPLPFFN